MYDYEATLSGIFIFAEPSEMFQSSISQLIFVIGSGFWFGIYGAYTSFTPECPMQAKQILSLQKLGHAKIKFGKISVLFVGHWASPAILTTCIDLAPG